VETIAPVMTDPTEILNLGILVIAHEVIFGLAA